MCQKLPLQAFVIDTFNKVGSICFKIQLGMSTSGFQVQDLLAYLHSEIAVPFCIPREPFPEFSLHSARTERKHWYHNVVLLEVFAVAS